MAEKPTYEELVQRIKELEQEKLQAEAAREALIKRHGRPSDKIDEKTTSEISSSDFDLGSIINVEELQSIMNDFCAITNMATAILDLKGNVIEATGWQDICTKFHRKNPETANSCTESDLFLAKNLKPGEYVDYKCKNGLWDVVTPLYAGTRYVGNIYTGQFFYDDEKVDETFFIQQAATYGFEKDSYLEAFRRIPRYSRETIHHLMNFLVKFTTYISKIGLANIHLETEISQRKQTEERLKRSEALQSKMIANIGDVIVIIDKDGINRYKSPNIEKLFGWKPEEVVGISAWNNVHPEDLASAQKFFGTLLLAPNAVGTVECRYKCKDGSYRWIEFTGSNFLYDSDIRGILGNYHDINDRKQSEQLLRESEYRFKVLHNASFGGIAIHDKGIILECNQGMSTMTGYSVEELIGMDGLLLIAEKSRNLVMNKILSGYEKSYEAFGLRKNGEEFPMSLEARNIPYKGKKVRTVEFRDITERYRAAEKIRMLNQDLELRVRQRTAQLEEANKELEDFVYSVSHDLRAPLRSISGFAEIIDRRHKASLNEEGQHYFDNIIKASKQMGGLIDDLLSFSRLGRKAIKSEAVSLEDVFKTATETLSDTIKKTAARISLPEKMPLIQGDITLTTHLFINLLENAIKYHQPDEVPAIDVGFEVEDESVVVSVTDNGIGIAPEYHEKIFNIFQRLHSQAEYPGTGIGLAAVKKAVQIMGGQAWVESEPGKGSIFKIKLLKAMIA